MNLKKMLVPVALIASTLAPLAASAHPYERYDNDGWGRHERRFEYRNYGYYANAGQRWVPGHYEQVWVPEQCNVRPRFFGEAVRCRPGFYDNRWVPGHYIAW